MNVYVHVGVAVALVLHVCVHVFACFCTCVCVISNSTGLPLGVQLKSVNETSDVCACVHTSLCMFASVHSCLQEEYMESSL